MSIQRLIRVKVLNNYLDKWGSLFMTSKSSSIIDLCLRAVKNPDLREPVINQKYKVSIDTFILRAPKWPSIGERMTLIVLSTSNINQKANKNVC